jgi:hypothetical protein
MAILIFFLYFLNFLAFKYIWKSLLFSKKKSFQKSISLLKVIFLNSDTNSQMICISIIS